jgi:hypothetical protein
VASPVVLDEGVAGGTMTTERGSRRRTSGHRAVTPERAASTSSGVNFWTQRWMLTWSTSTP